MPRHSSNSAYRNYIQSSRWQKKRKERLKFDGFRCALCGNQKNLQVHHITYDRLGDENINDLITLCKTCHRKIEIYKKRESMQKPRNYDNTKAQGEQMDPVALGGHKLIIKQVSETKSKAGKDMLVVLFDFNIDDRQPFRFADDFEADIRPNKKWPFQGTQYILVEDKDGNCSRAFKGFMTSVERSNPTFSCEWGINFGRQFQNKLVGGVFGEEEDEYNGKVRTLIKLRYFCEYDKADGAKTPEKKTLSGKTQSSTASQEPQDISSLPF